MAQGCIKKQAFAGLILQLFPWFHELAKTKTNKQTKKKTQPNQASHNVVFLMI